MPDSPDRPPSELSIQDEALRLLGPLSERRIPVYHLDEIAAVVRALDSAWMVAAPHDLLARLRATAFRFLVPGVVLEEEGTLVLLVTAPASVCSAFDDQAGRLDSHTEFGR